MYTDSSALTEKIEFYIGTNPKFFNLNWHLILVMMIIYYQFCIKNYSVDLKTKYLFEQKMIGSFYEK